VFRQLVPIQLKRVPPRVMSLHTTLHPACAHLLIQTTLYLYSTQPAKPHMEVEGWESIAEELLSKVLEDGLGRGRRPRGAAGELEVEKHPRRWLRGGAGFLNAHVARRTSPSAAR
jgi:hypothetical protein